jgi:hypothetical protein
MNNWKNEPYKRVNKLNEIFNVLSNGGIKKLSNNWINEEKNDRSKIEVKCILPF